MRPIRTSTKFDRVYTKFIRNNRRLQSDVERALILLSENSTHSELHVHSLKGQLSGFSACTCRYDCRIIFQIRTDGVTNEEYILLVDIGTHDEVYYIFTVREQVGLCYCVDKSLITSSSAAIRSGMSL
jgi:mRNA interferase YafQ